MTKTGRIQPGESVTAYLERAINGVLIEAGGIKSQLQAKALEEKDKQGGGDTADEDIFGDMGDEEQPDQQAKAQPAATPKQQPAAPPAMSPDTADIGREMGGPQEKIANDDVESLKAVPEMSDVVDKLNAVRSGKSFKDQNINAAFEQYYGGLKDTEKLALFAFLKGIAQVTSGQVAGNKAVEPEDKPADIEMSKGNEPQSRGIKPNVIKKVTPQKPDGSSTNGAEDTTGPTPVQPKRRM